MVWPVGAVSKMMWSNSAISASSVSSEVNSSRPRSRWCRPRKVAPRYLHHVFGQHTFHWPDNFVAVCLSSLLGIISSAASRRLPGSR